MLEERDRARLREGLSGATADVSLILRRDNGDAALAARLEEVAHDVQSATGGAVAVRRGDAAGLPAGPALTIARGAIANLHYLALPEGLETDPFVDLLVASGGGTPPAREPWARSLAGLSTPAEILVFVSAACPNCAHTVRAAQRVALASPAVTTTVVDAQRFEALAERYQVKSVPVTLVDRELALHGPVAPDELAARILGRGGVEHGMRIFVSLVEANRMDDAAMRVLEADGAVEMAAAWSRSAMSLRLGLMLVTEQVLGENPHALDRIVPRLLEVLTSDDPSLRGDTADLLGQIGSAEALPALERLTADPHADVAEMATEAVQQIRDRA